MQKNLIFNSAISAFIVLLISLGGCSYLLPEPHKIDIQQGNRVKQEDLAKIKLGMNRNQVKFVLGTPLLQDAFNRDRWDYLYFLKPGEGEIKQSRLSLYFKGDELVRIDDRAYRPEMQKTGE